MKLSDKNYLILISAVAILLATGPFLWLWHQTPANQIYLGTGSYNPGDLPVYYSYIEQVRQGHWTFIDLFTNENQPIRFFNIFWLAVGLMAKIFNLTPPLAFHLARLLLIPFLVWTLKKTIDFFYPTKNWRYLLLAALTVTGPGILLMPFIHRVTKYDVWAGLDMVAAEATPLGSIIFSGHFIASWICLLWSIMFTCHGFRTNRWQPFLGAGLVNLIFIQFHPYYAPFIFLFTALVFLYYFFTRYNRRQWLAVLALILPLPSILYYLWLFTADQRFYIFSKQNFTPTPKLWVVLLSFGLLLPLAIISLKRLIKNKIISEQEIILILWFITSLILLYAPLASQRRFIEGMVLPLLLLAWPILELIYLQIKKIYPYLPKNFYVWLASGLFLIFFSLSGLVVYQMSFQMNAFTTTGLYLNNTGRDAINFIKQNTTTDALFLTPDGSTSFITGLSGRQFYGWHASETTYAQIKKQILLSFFNSAGEEARKTFLQRNKITHLYWNRELDSTYNFHPEEKNYLTKIYDNKEVQIYVVN